MRRKRPPLPKLERKLWEPFLSTHRTGGPREIFCSCNRGRSTTEASLRGLTPNEFATRSRADRSDLPPAFWTALSWKILIYDAWCVSACKKGSDSLSMQLRLRVALVSRRRNQRDGTCPAIVIAGPAGVCRR